MKLISWNVNGIRAALKNGFLDSTKKLDPDVICIQETKAHPEQVDKFLENYKSFWNSAEKKGYSGTAIFTKQEPKEVMYGIGKKEHDTEGRVITAKFKDFTLVNVYVPNSKRELLRKNYRIKWDIEFLKHLKKQKNLIVCGDFNVAHTEIDLKNPKPNWNKTAGYTEFECNGFDNILNAGYIDTFRSLYPDTIKYSWWSYMFQARQKGIGWRIDYFLLDPSLKSKLKNAVIHNEIYGSDHCPIGITLDHTVKH